MSFLWLHSELGIGEEGHTHIVGYMVLSDPMKSQSHTSNCKWTIRSECGRAADYRRSLIGPKAPRIMFTNTFIK